MDASNTNGKAILLAYNVPKSEGWEESASHIISMINAAHKEFPGKPRILVLDIEGHRTETGAFDYDTWVLQQDIINELLSHWLTEVQLPLIHYRTNPEHRRPDSELPLKLFTDGETAFIATVTPDERVLFASCRYCHTALIRINEQPEQWVHFITRDGRPGRVACRAASFDRQGDWDDSLDRRWKASPDKATIRDRP